MHDDGDVGNKDDDVRLVVMMVVVVCAGAAAAAAAQYGSVGDNHDHALSLLLWLLHPMSAGMVMRPQSVTQESWQSALHRKNMH